MSRNASKHLTLKVVLTRWDFVVIRWGLNPAERSALIGGFNGGPVTAIETYELLCGEQRMRLIVELEPVLNRVMDGEEQVRRWLRESNPNLGGRTPIDVMTSSPEWIRWLIDNVRTGS